MLDKQRLGVEDKAARPGESEEPPGRRCCPKCRADGLAPDGDEPCPRCGTPTVPRSEEPPCPR